MMLASFRAGLAAAGSTIRRGLKLEGVRSKHESKVVHHIKLSGSLSWIEAITEHSLSPAAIEHRREEHALMLLLLMLRLLLLKFLSF